MACRARRRRRRAAPDPVTPNQAAELVIGPTPRGTWFASPAERARLRGLQGLPVTPGIAACERQLDAARDGFAAAGEALRTVEED